VWHAVLISAAAFGDAIVQAAGVPKAASAVNAAWQILDTGKCMTAVSVVSSGRSRWCRILVATAYHPPLLLVYTSDGAKTAADLALLTAVLLVTGVKQAQYMVHAPCSHGRPSTAAACLYGYGNCSCCCCAAHIAYTAIETAAVAVELRAYH
jgi:hypothetical protein